VSNPWTTSSTLEERAIISAPDQPWEKTPYNRTINVRLNSNEGPEQLVNPYTNQTFIIYSAARSDNRNYCLGQLELVGSDPMNPASWKKYTDYCVFYQNPEEEAYGVGHASFTTSPDGSEWWIVYHGMKDPTNGWSARTIRAQKFDWNEDGTPNFPRPGYGPYPVPSGQQGEGPV
jgi:GH43 family beta-xylosidase